MKLIRHFKQFPNCAATGGCFFTYSQGVPNYKTVWFKFPKKFNLQTWTNNYDLEFSESREAPVDFEDSFLFSNEYSDGKACLNWETQSWFLREGIQTFVFISVPVWVNINFGDEVCFFRLNTDIRESEQGGNSFSYCFVYNFAFNKNKSKLSKYVMPNVGRVEIVVEYNNVSCHVAINEQISAIKISDDVLDGGYA